MLFFVAYLFANQSRIGFLSFLMRYNKFISRMLNLMISRTDFFCLKTVQLHSLFVGPVKLVELRNNLN